MNPERPLFAYRQTAPSGKNAQLILKGCGGRATHLTGEYFDGLGVEALAGFLVGPS